MKRRRGEQVASYTNRSRYYRMSGRTGMSQKRLIKELRELEKDLPQGVK